jgi:hypothetical protein
MLFLGFLAMVGISLRFGINVESGK